MTEIFTDPKNSTPADSVVIRTDAMDENEFIIELANVLYEVMEPLGAVEKVVALRKILSFSADICATFRGYKTSVQTKTLMITGNFIEPEMKLLSSYNCAKIQGY